MTRNALSTASILLPTAGIDPAKWAVIACDQFTSQPDYWNKVEAIVADSPSTLRLTLPELYLSERTERLEGIRNAMNTYLADGTLSEAVNGFVLVERETIGGTRLGLVGAVDLDAYDPAKGSVSLIRATEETVPARVPPRAEIRSGAPIELPHVMMLIDDPKDTVIGALYARRDTLRPLYDLDLMLGGGHLRGMAVEGKDLEGVFNAIDALANTCDGVLYAVGDGNHSLAAAKMCWTNIRETLSEAERENHPARYALVELVNLHSPALVFEPIHRIMFHADIQDLGNAFTAWLTERGIPVREGTDVRFITENGMIGYDFDGYALPILQPFLDAYLKAHAGADIDYIHGEEDVRTILGEHTDSVGILLRAFDKAELFPAIRRYGVLPRKSFSMGEATDKRYYMEARKIR